MGGGGSSAVDSSMQEQPQKHMQTIESVPQWLAGVMVPDRRSTTSIGPEMGDDNAGICEYVSKLRDDRIKKASKKKRTRF